MPHTTVIVVRGSSGAAAGLMEVGADSTFASGCVEFGSERPIVAPTAINTKAAPNSAREPIMELPPYGSIGVLDRVQ